MDRERCYTCRTGTGEGGSQAAAERQKILRNSSTSQAAKADTTPLCAPHTAAFFVAALTLLITVGEKTTKNLGF